MAPMGEMARPMDRMMAPAREMMPGGAAAGTLPPAPGGYGYPVPPRGPEVGARDAMGRMMAPMKEMASPMDKMMEPMHEMAPPMDRMMPPMPPMMGSGSRQGEPASGPPPAYPPAPPSGAYGYPNR